MIDSLRRVAQTVTINPDCELDGAVPTLHHRTATLLQQVDITYKLSLTQSALPVCDIQATYRVGFTDLADLNTDIAQDTSWPYFRQDVALALQGLGTEINDVLPVLNPLKPVGLTDVEELPRPVSPNRPIQAALPQTNRPTWQGVFPHRFEVARGLIRSLDEIANKQRQWFWSALRLYAALLLADHLAKESRTRDGVTVEVHQSKPDAFQTFFENETGIRLEAWEELEEDSDRIFFESLARNLLIVIHDAVREDSAHEVTAELYDDYLQEVDEYIEETEVVENEADESAEPYVPRQLVGREKRVLELAVDVMQRPPLKEKLTMLELAMKFSRFATGLPSYSTAEAEERAGYFEVWTKEGEITHPIRYVYSAKDDRLEFVVELEIGDDYFQWNGTDKEWLQHGDFPSLKRYFIHRAESEELPDLPVEALEASVPTELWDWAPNAGTVGAVMAVLPDSLSDEDVALLGSLVDIDLSEISRRIDNLHMLKLWAERKDVRARLGIVQNPLCDDELLTKLAHDVSRFVREAVAAHPDCPKSVWEKLSEDAWQVQVALIEHHTVPSELLWKMVHSSNRKGRAALAERCPDIPGLFEFLANDADPQVRASVALNPQAPASVLHSLCQDDNEAVAELAEMRFS